MTWLLCDYGGVLSLPQPPADREAIEALAGQAGPDFWTTYWDHRPAYDRGDMTADPYWTAVLGTRPAPTLLDALVEVDAASWLHPDVRALAAASRAAERGLRLAILSNAPHEVAAAIDTREWLGAFAPRLFSCDLRTIKPEPAIYLATLEALHAQPRDIVFFDDRPVNVIAARKIGIHAEVFTDPAQIDGIQPGREHIEQT